MMRAFWSGDIHFGLVTIPVKLYTSVRDPAAQVHHLHKACGTRITMVRRCPQCDEDLAVEDIGKAREVAKDKFRLLTKRELAQLEGDVKGRSIEILQFVDRAEVDLTYLERSYWVGAGSKNRRGYELLWSTLVEQAKMVAVARVKLRTRARLALVRPRRGLLSLDMLRSVEELIAGDELEAGERIELKPRERQLAARLVEQMSGSFDPAGCKRLEGGNDPHPPRGRTVAGSGLSPGRPGPSRVRRASEKGITARR